MYLEGEDYELVDYTGLGTNTESSILLTMCLTIHQTVSFSLLPQGDHSYNLLEVMLENENDIDPLFTYFKFKNYTPYSRVLMLKTPLFTVQLTEAKVKYGTKYWLTPKYM
jgi:hypothetical protein